MEIIKTILGIVAMALSVISYVPYVRDTLSGKTTPHVYTWLVGSLTP